MTTFETLRMEMAKILIEDFDDDHPLWDIWWGINKAEAHMHRLAKVAEAARNYFTEHDLGGLSEKYFKDYHAVKEALEELDEARRG